MTVTLQTTINRYIGLAADTKPTGVPVGSEFLAYDTGAIYVTHDGTNWVAKPLMPDGASVALGTTTDAPYVGAESATARTGISLLKGIKNTVYDALGAAADAIVAAGAVGSISAKLRRVTQGLEDLKSLIVLGAGTNNIGDVDVLTEPSGDGTYTTATNSAANVAVTTTEVLAANANRLYALIVNDSDTTIYLAVGAAAVANAGIRLNANGGHYEMSKKIGNLNVGAINGIHAGTGTKVACKVEGV